MKLSRLPIKHKPRNPKPTAPAPRHQFINLFFHSFTPEGALHWQGYIADDIGHRYFLIQLCEWITGGPSNLRVVHLSTMVHWKFYLDQRDWVADGDRYGRLAPRKAETMT